MDTVYGKPSGSIGLFEQRGVQIAFIPRHGYDHSIPPHRVPYKANLTALHALGVRHVIATCVVGSLRQEIEPGTFVVPDQFINLTWGRDDTFDSDRRLVHLPMAHPYCSHIGKTLSRELEGLCYPNRPSGCVVVIQGPRFSTIAESKMFAQWGGDIVNMTQYPECYFARELGMCYGVVASVTDYDVGVPGAVSMQPDSMERVLAVFRNNTQRTLALLNRVIETAPGLSTCSCAQDSVSPYYAQP